MSHVSAKKIDRRAHWQKIYACKLPSQAGWFQAEPTLSQQLIEGSSLADPIIAVGGPELRSRLPVVQTDTQKLPAGLGPGFRLRGGRTGDRITRAGRVRKFTCSRLLGTG